MSDYEYEYEPEYRRKRLKQIHSDIRIIVIH